MRTRKKDNFLQ